MKRILITGVCGFAGSTLAAELLNRESGLHLIGIDNLCRKGSETNVDRIRALGVDFFQGDLRHEKDLEALPAADWVFDCAANPSVLAGTGKSSPDEVVGHNLIGTLRLLEYCRRHQSGLILMSTSRVYSIEAQNKIPLEISGNRFQPRQDLKKEIQGFSQYGISEAFPAEPPLSLYGATKRASEIMALEYGNAFSFPVWINRASVLAGPGQFGKIDQGILGFWIYQYILGRPLAYFGYGGKGFQVRDFLHPADLAPLILKQMAEPLKTDKPRIVNLGGGLVNSLSLAELSAWCDRRSGKQKEIGAHPENRLFDVPYYVSDNRLAEKVWAWSPRIPLEKILEETWQWALQNQELVRSFS